MWLPQELAFNYITYNDSSYLNATNFNMESATAFVGVLSFFNKLLKITWLMNKPVIDYRIPSAF